MVCSEIKRGTIKNYTAKFCKYVCFCKTDVINWDVGQNLLSTFDNPMLCLSVEHHACQVLISSPNVNQQRLGSLPSHLCCKVSMIPQRRTLYMSREIA